MKVEINNISRDSANSMLEVYAHNTRPCCKIYEEDFAELLTDAQLKKFENGHTKFDVNKDNLIDKCKIWFG